MGQTLNIGRRFELIPMDPHCHDISIGLYRQQHENGAAFRVHTYSQIAEAKKRLAFIEKAMCILGGMEKTSDGMLHFPCWQVHEMGCKRIFLEACKLPSDTDIEPRPLKIFDKKSGLDITVSRTEDSIYQVTAEGEGKDKEKRISFIAGGLMKLGQMDEMPQSLDKVSFLCGHSHDAMVSLLLVRAPNVRAVLREQESTAARGVLAAPSQQE